MALPIKERTKQDRELHRVWNLSIPARSKRGQTVPPLLLSRAKACHWKQCTHSGRCLLSTDPGLVSHITPVLGASFLSSWTASNSRAPLAGWFLHSAPRLSCCPLRTDGTAPSFRTTRALQAIRVCLLLLNFKATHKNIFSIPHFISESLVAWIF